MKRISSGEAQLLSSLKTTLSSLVRFFSTVSRKRSVSTASQRARYRSRTAERGKRERQMRKEREGVSCQCSQKAQGAATKAPALLESNCDEKMSNYIRKRYSTAVHVNGMVKTSRKYKHISQTCFYYSYQHLPYPTYS